MKSAIVTRIRRLLPDRKRFAWARFRFCRHRLKLWMGLEEVVHQALIFDGDTTLGRHKSKAWARPIHFAASPNRRRLRETCDLLEAAEEFRPLFQLPEYLRLA